MNTMNRYASRFAALLIAAVVLLSASAAHAADEHAAAADKVGRFLMVLRQPGARGNGKDVKEPDVAPLGGKVIERSKNGVVIDLPLAALKRLRDDENVAIVQRIWMGEPLETWAAEAAAAEPDAPVSSSRVHALETATAATWSSGDYAYDPSGNITAIGTNSYFYDSAQRLISSNTSGVAETYRYDSFGNLVEKTIAGRPAGSITVDPGSNRLTGVEYDVAGNQLTDSSRAAVYTYDSVGMLVKAVPPQGGSPTRMIYTADDERIGTLVDANTAYWRVRDFTSSQVLREWMSDGGSAWFWNEDFIYADGHLVAGERETYYGGKRHFTLDHLGSVRMVTRTDKTRLQSKEFLPFGVERTPSNQELVNLGYTSTRPEPMNFAGHERDFRGPWDTDNTDYLDDMHARFYNPNVGRFLSLDPVLGDVRSPQSWNRYAYVENRPINRVDPNGKCGEGANFVGPTKPCLEVAKELLDNAALNVAKPALTVMVGFRNDNLKQVAVGSAGLVASALTGKVGQLARLLYTVATTTKVYRAVDSAEKLDIQRTGQFRPSPNGTTHKGFFFEPQDAADLGNRLKTLDGQQYSVVAGRAPDSVINSAPPHTAAGEGPGVLLPNEKLPHVDPVDPQ